MFESYKLGVYRVDGDIDRLATCTDKNRDKFSSSFVATLKKESCITELHPVPRTHILAIKFCLNDVPIDLVFTSMNLNPMYVDDNYFQELDVVSEYSLNGIFAL